MNETRYYDLEQLTDKKKVENELTIAYARVSSHDQKQDLERQVQVLTNHCIKQTWEYQIIQDLEPAFKFKWPLDCVKASGMDKSQPG